MVRSSLPQNTLMHFLHSLTLNMALRMQEKAYKPLPSPLPNNAFYAHQFLMACVLFPFSCPRETESFDL
jgi:hypothetical protein